MNRRTFIAASATSSLLGASLRASSIEGAASKKASPQDAVQAATNPGRQLRQSVCRWCYGRIPLDELCRRAAEFGYQSVELLSEDEWHVPAEYGLTCAVANGPVSIAQGINRIESHDKFVADCERLLPMVAAASIPHMIVFSGNRRGMDDEQGLQNCKTALNRVVGIAKNHNVTIIMELLNSKVDHGDYMCDRTPWGVKLVDAVGSDHFKLLYDIYHLQIMEGDIIRTIRDYHDYIAHYHTGGVPGRREIDHTQELYYPAICRAILETGFDGYLGQEFIPRNDPMESLKAAFEICTVQW